MNHALWQYCTMLKLTFFESVVLYPSLLLEKNTRNCNVTVCAVVASRVKDAADIRSPGDRGLAASGGTGDVSKTLCAVPCT